MLRDRLIDLDRRRVWVTVAAVYTRADQNRIRADVDKGWHVYAATGAVMRRGKHIGPQRPAEDGVDSLPATRLGVSCYEIREARWVEAGQYETPDPLSHKVRLEALLDLDGRDIITVGHVSINDYRLVTGTNRYQVALRRIQRQNIHIRLRLPRGCRSLCAAALKQRVV